MSKRLKTGGLLAAACAVGLVGASADLSSYGVEAATSTGSRAAASPTARPDLIPLPGPGHFARHVTNRYMPWKVGSRWVYRGSGSEGGERDVVVVLDRTREIEGITATVVRDVVRHHGRLIERTFDWYAQDDRGRVWYLGENTHAYDHGEVSTEGSWEAGVDGAKPGVVMFAHPKVGRSYWQEHYAGHAEDLGKTLDLSTQVTIASGRYQRVRMTEDTTPLEPRITEFKFYAPGVGSVFALDVSPEQGSVELVSFTKP